jgi:hypothetical protein
MSKKDMSNSEVGDVDVEEGVIKSIEIGFKSSG